MLVVAVLAGCLPSVTFVDETSLVIFRGARYSGGVASGYNIAETDLTPIGLADQVAAGVGRDVLALRGIDPAKIIVMRAADAESASKFWLFFRHGILADAPNPPLSNVPELCRYVITQAARDDLC